MIGSTPRPASAHRGAVGLLSFALCCAAAPVAAQETAAATPVVEPATPASPAQIAPWSLRIPPQPGLAYRGVASFDDAGTGAMGMMYPAPSAAGLLAAVVTHALIADSAKSRQKNEIQAKADEVLTPYRPAIDAFTAGDLWARAAEQLKLRGCMGVVDATQPPGASRIVGMEPVFLLTQDQRALVLETTVVVSLPGEDPSSAKRVGVRVVSSPWEPAADAADPVAYWGGNEAARLKHESASLLAQSLDLALNEVLATAPAPQAAHRTFRYREGQRERAERGQLIAQSCGRVVIRNLRGTLMSIPLADADASGQAECDAPKGAS